MSDLMLPSPQGPDPASRGDAPSQGKRQDEATRDRPRSRPGKRSAIPSPDDCLRAIAQLPGLVAMGFLKPPQANTIRASYREILQQHKAKAREAEKGLSNANVMEVLRKDPQLLSMLEPLLTAEQVAMIMKATHDGGNG